MLYKSKNLISMTSLFVICTICGWTHTAFSADELFPADSAVKEWVEFKAEGFTEPVSAILYSNEQPTCCGLPLGGLGTGCIDIDADGVIGFNSVFRPAYEVKPTPYWTLRSPKEFAPFLGISVNEKTWVLADKKYIEGGDMLGCVDPVEPGTYLEEETYMAHWKVTAPKIDDVLAAEKIMYWGHYPVADIEYKTSCPVGVALRAWAPFIPGDSSASAIPGAVFEIHLRNQTNKAQTGTVAFNFPGPVQNEVGIMDFRRTLTNDDGLTAMTVKANRSNYTVAVLGQEDVKFGGDLSVGGEGWSKITSSLPVALSQDPGTSAAVKFSLKPNENKTVKIVLAWYLTHWQAGNYNEIQHFDETWTKNEYILSKTDRRDHDIYYPMYTVRYNGPLDVAKELATKNETLLKRILAWQQAVFTQKGLPVWLKESLINNLALYAEDSLWVTPAGKIADWAYPAGGFQLTECPRTCAIVGCTASNYYGDLPTTYFFPELERMILKSYMANMRPDGAIPFLYPTKDFTKCAYEWQIGLNGACFADLVHRLWLRTGDNTIVEEFYPAIKKNTIFTVNLKKGEHGIISFHREGTGQEWWEHTAVFGMVTHLAGVRLAQLEMAKKMAIQMGDKDFAAQCAQWIDKASSLMEENLWNEETKSYDFFNYPEKDMKNEDIMASQLDGQWMVNLNGLPDVFRKDRIKTALKTIADYCLVDMGLAGFAVPGKGPDLERYGTFPPETHIVAMTYMYNGDPKLGLEIARRNVDNMVRVHGYTWDLPNLISCEDGHRTYGCDYYQNMILWGLPAAITGTDLSGPCKADGVVARILQAGK